MTDAESEDGRVPLSEPPKIAPNRTLWRQWAMEKAVSLSFHRQDRTPAELNALADSIYEWVMRS